MEYSGLPCLAAARRALHLDFGRGIPARAALGQIVLQHMDRGRRNGDEDDRHHNRQQVPIGGFTQVVARADHPHRPEQTAEQVEEEKNASDIIATLKMIGEKGQALHMLDRELGKRGD